MASSRVETALAWSASASVSLSTNNVVASDAIALNVEDWDGQLHVHCDNSGTPASGDTVDLWISYNMGAITGSGDVWNTDEHAIRLGRIDTYATNTPGEDPAATSFDINTAAKGFKLLARANQGATRAITLRAMVTTHRPQ